MADGSTISGATTSGRKRTPPAIATSRRSRAARPCHDARFRRRMRRCDRSLCETSSRVGLQGGLGESGERMGLRGSRRRDQHRGTAAAMNISPTAYVVFFLVWSVAAVLVAHVWYAFSSERRYAALLAGAAIIFVLGCVGVLIVGLWNDLSAASSLLQQRVYLVALACEATAVSLLIALKVYRLRLLEPAWRASAGLLLFVLGVALGTTDLAGASFSDVVGRLSGAWLLMVILVLCRPQARHTVLSAGGAAVAYGGRGPRRREAVASGTDRSA